MAVLVVVESRGGEGNILPAGNASLSNSGPNSAFGLYVSQIGDGKQILIESKRSFH